MLCDTFYSSHFSPILHSLGNEISYWLFSALGLTADYTDYTDHDDPHKGLKKTRPLPCDKEIDLYEMQPMDANPLNGQIAKCAEGCDKKFVVQVGKS